MSLTKQIFTFVIALALPASAADEPAKKEPNDTSNSAKPARSGVLWTAPEDISKRNLFYGSGGEGRQPHGTTFAFEKEDMNGTNPKLDVRDSDGVKWKLKMGTEARPETAATRLVWAAGYFTQDDYFINDAQVEGLPQHLHRGGTMIGPGGEIPKVRLKRNPEGYEKAGIWKWKRVPMKGTREYNGLRVMMALINNWDLKDVNNEVFEKKKLDRGGPDEIYMVTDLGASFGPTRVDLHHVGHKGILKYYAHSRFITKATAEYVDFADPGRPTIMLFFNPKAYFIRVGEEWIGRRVPRADAQWIGGILAQLSHEQVRDAFRAAGYLPEEVEGFTAVVEKRIDMLNHL